MSVLVLENIAFGWNGDRRVLSDLSFAPAAGETVGLIGPNGAGKTTLFLLCAGIVKPSAGRIELLGAAPGDPSLRGKVGLVFQNAGEQLFCTTVAEDVAFGPRNLGLPAEEVRARVAEALALVRLAGVESRAPHHMSGGEERKAALAAALAMRPELLLLDEPTSDLDSRSRRELLDVVRHLPGSKVIASHDFEFLHELCDRVAVLSDGRIRGEGTPAAIFGDEELLARCGLELSRGMRALLGLGRA